MALFLYHLPSQCTTAQENTGNGPKQLAGKDDAAHDTTAELKRGLATIDFRHDFTKQQQQECQQDGDTQKLQPLGSLAKADEVGKYVVEQHDDGDVDKIVADENRCQRALAVVAKLLDVPVGCALRLVKHGLFSRRKTKESNLRPTGKC